MKKYLIIYRNWRVTVLAALSLLAMFLLFCECDDTGLFLLTKTLGFGLVYIIYRLGKYWEANGKINDLMELAEEE